MSKKRDFEEQLLAANMALRRNRKIKKKIRDKSDGKTTDSLLSPDASIYAKNEDIDVEEEFCVVEIPSTSDHQNVSDPNVIEMSAADKLKSQSNQSVSKQITAQSIGSLGGSATATPTSTSAKSNKKRKTPRRGSGTSSEEERWLDAIESGKLEQVDDELKKFKDPKLMTARQRAMYERSIEKDPSPGGDVLLALPTGYKEKVMTAEALEKAQLKSQKRKQLADEKREKDKQKTMDRLLKKQETKLTKVAKNKIIKFSVPVISYYESISNGPSLSYPINFEFPIQAQPERVPPAIILCAICNDSRKRYNCTKTNVPLCSFRCYKSNLMRKQIAC